MIGSLLWSMVYGLHSSIDNDDQAELLEAFLVFDSRKVRSTFLALTSGSLSSEKSQDDVEM